MPCTRKSRRPSFLEDFAWLALAFVAGVLVAAFSIYGRACLNGVW